MSQYVLAGGPFTIMDTPHSLEVWGQPVEIPDELAASAMASGACLLPKAEFDKLGFTAEEIKSYTNARAQAQAPAEFHKKREAAIDAARAYAKALPDANSGKKTPSYRDETGGKA